MSWAKKEFDIAVQSVSADGTVITITAKLTDDRRYCVEKIFVGEEEKPWKTMVDVTPGGVMPTYDELMNLMTDYCNNEKLGDLR